MQPDACDMLFDPRYGFLHDLSIIVAGLLLVAAWRAPLVGRGLYFGLFAGAACLNLFTVIAMPIGEGAGPVALGAETPAFVRGAFADNDKIALCAIALLQAMVAVALFGGDRLGRFGVGGAFVYCAGIAPLGQGATFPSTLLLAAGALLLLRGDALEGSLWDRVSDARDARARVRRARSRGIPGTTWRVRSEPPPARRPLPAQGLGRELHARRPLRSAP